MSTETQEPKKKRKRSSDRSREPLTTKPRGSKTICLPISQEEYGSIFDTPKAYRSHVDALYNKHPELFPSAMSGGYRLHDRLPASKKLPEVKLRRLEIKANGEVYTIRPSFVLPYMTGYTDDVEKALFLHTFGVRFWALTRVYGHNDMYWERLTEQIGHNSIVGTTVRKPELLPQDLVADEKHSEICGKPAYIATTVGGDCVLGAAVSASADEKDLTEAYTHR